MNPVVTELEVEHSRHNFLETVRDVFVLSKPRITSTVLITTAAGMKLAPGSIPSLRWLWSLLGTALIVSSANALNMYIERDIDAKMDRTKHRPLPAGRLSPAIALIFGIVCACVGLPILAFAVNPMTGLLGAIAVLSYVLVYTPMKRYSTWALWVGAVPGAIPPLLGWSSVTGEINRGGLALFAILFLWQIPHFLAISLVRERDYTQAGLKVMPAEKGERATYRTMIFYSLALWIVSLWPLLERVGGFVYGVVAFGLGILMMLFVLRGRLYFQNNEGSIANLTLRIRWARKVFMFSVLYLVSLFTSLVLIGNLG